MDSQNNENNIQELMSIFQLEYEEILERIFNTIEELRQAPGNREIVATLYRDLHSLKGAIRMVGFTNIQIIVHKIEDIFDKVKELNIVLPDKIINIICADLELVSKYTQDSIINQREILDERFKPVVEELENICENGLCDTNVFDMSQKATEDTNNKVAEAIQSHLEDINTRLNNCFQMIDEFVPEEECSNAVILKEELLKIYEIIEEYDIYEVKNSLQNLIAKLEFVMNVTNTFTISEILEMRNELSSAAAKLNTCAVNTESSELTFFDIAEKVQMLQSSSIYAQEIKDDIEKIKTSVQDTNINEIINIIIENLDFIIDNSVQLEEQMLQTLKSGVEYCAAPNENIDSDLIVQQLEIMKQLLELNYKKDADVSEIRALSTQTSVTGKSNSANEIKTLHVNAQKLDTLVNQLGELIIAKITTEKNLEKIELIKNANENCQKDLLKTSNYLRYYNRKNLQTTSTDQYVSTFVKQAFSLLADVSQNISKTIYDLNSLYHSSKEDDIKMRLIINEMESMVKNIRVLPIATVFNSFSRMVRDIATEKGKEIDFDIQGNDTCADKKIIEEIKTPLIHILRNAIDHGIETKEERLLAGKSPVGKIILSATQDDNKIVIDVVDDGQGFNLEKIKSRAVARGFLTQDDVETMTDEAIMNVIFWPGFTTGDSITSISGRGIGLDVVKTKISQLNGKVKVISEFGKGSCVHIEIPVTLTTLRVFLVEVSGQIFAIPIHFITTFILKQQNEIKTNNGTRSIVYGDKIIPLYYLADILGIKSAAKKEKEIVLIIESDDKTICLVVDKLLGDQDVLQKKLPSPLYKVKNISGITNLASGELCLILNIRDIIHFDLKISTTTNEKPKMLTNDILSYKKILVVDDSMTTRSLIKNILLNVGYGVDTVLDVSEALVKMKLNHYDLIITDINMPKVNGYEFVEMLQTDEMYADIPILVLTSDSQDAVMKKLVNYKVNGCIQKDSFDQEFFVQKVKETLTKFHD